MQIEQVLLNLTHNSIEAMREQECGPKRVVISAHQRGRERITVSVADTGPGLDANQMKRMFTPFYTTKSNGMGMGLSISRSIIEAHGGELWVAPEARGGTTLLFTLPAFEHERTT
ncbi:MAG TPA: ATP-binding protein [Steroidobacteraceae bacterium]